MTDHIPAEAVRAAVEARWPQFLRPEPSEDERVKRAEACIAEVERLADLDVRCPCCTGYGNILDAIATYQNGADHDD